MKRLPKELPSREITPEALFLTRREWLKNAALTVGTAAALGGSLSWLVSKGPPPDPPEEPALVSALPTPVPAVTRTDQTNDPPTPYVDVTTYNNFYEFGLDKSDPARHAHTLTVRPWTIAVDGEVARPQVIDIDTLLGWFPLEERVYRMRCVEAWSMVIPWLGFPLGDLIKRLEPTGKAKYVEFITLVRPQEMPGQRWPLLDWPYVEGLRLDEAQHPLTILAAGLYGKMLPNQNGAPLRLVVPWKYGFKSIKSIVRIRFTETKPGTTWALSSPHEYGFYANVNPAVDHPRWSQASERRIGEFWRRPTLPFNGYAAEVAGLYAGLDLVKNY